MQMTAYVVRISHWSSDVCSSDLRDAHAFLVEQFFLAEPVIAEIVAMVAGQHDQRILHAAFSLQKGEQPAEMIVELLDQPHIGRDHRLARLVAAEIDRLLRSEEHTSEIQSLMRTSYAVFCL